MTDFSGLNRKEILKELESEVLDVLIIGGGITGAGIALDATTRGLKTGLVEMQDFAAGTSSRSTKLVHGGLRYLKQFEIKLVAEVGKERAIVYENGPHVTTPEWMLLPIHKGGTFGRFSTSIGLRVYDYLAGVKKIERRKMLSAKATLDKEPLLKKDKLLGGGYYVEYRTDDARLTIEVLKKSVEFGAKAVNYSKVNNLIYNDGKVVGTKLTDTITGKSYTVYAKKIINATGPWVDSLREMDRSKSGKALKLTKGVHIVIDHKKFPLSQAIYFDTSDGRMVFAIPRDGKTYVGTTDTFYTGDLAHPRMNMKDRDYLLHTIDYMFPEVRVTEKDIESSWAGVRPLIYEEGKDPSEISRKDEIWESDSGLVTIAGGKLTGYRKMAEVVVDLICKEKQCLTKTIPISGGDVGGSEHFSDFVEKHASEIISEFGIEKERAEKLVRLYGSNTPVLMEIMKDIDKADTTIPIDILAAVEYGIRYEMVTKPTDFFVRRTGAIFFNIKWVNQWKNEIVAYMAKRCKWNAVKKMNYKLELEQQIIEAVQPVADTYAQG